MWADTETETDFLNYSEIAELIAELIATPSLLPLSLGVFERDGQSQNSMRGRMWGKFSTQSLTI